MRHPILLRIGGTVRPAGGETKRRRRWSWRKLLNNIGGAVMLLLVVAAFCVVAGLFVLPFALWLLSPVLR
jgi:hypothetical protein